MSTTSFKFNDAAYNTNSAKSVIPFLTDKFKIESVIDIGCGTGTWLAVAKENGINDIIGLDGAYVDRSFLHIESDLFKEQDLSKTFNLNRKFDIAFCLEVAEHIDAANADNLVASIINHADLILFSAAIPGQDGEGHINEQWVDYWIEKFKKHNFVFYDVMRPHFWNDRNVEWWYKQNMFIVAREGHLPFMEKTTIYQYIHPDLFTRRKDLLEKYTKGKIPVLDAVKILVKTFLNLF